MDMCLAAGEMVSGVFICVFGRSRLTPQPTRSHDGFDPPPQA